MRFWNICFGIKPTATSNFGQMGESKRKGCEKGCRHTYYLFNNVTLLRRRDSCRLWRLAGVFDTIKKTMHHKNKKGTTGVSPIASLNYWIYLISSHSVSYTLRISA